MPSVLVADDAIFLRQRFIDILKKGGLDIAGEAANGVEVVEKFLELRPDLTLLDLSMPLRTGLEVIQEIRRHDPKARIVAYGTLAEVTAALEAGVNDFFQKPFQDEGVLRKIRLVLEHQ